MKSSVSIALFFLLSGFFLAVLLGAIEHSGRLLAVAGACLAAVVCIIVFLTPVELPSALRDPSRKAHTTTTENSTPASVTGTTDAAVPVSTTSPVTRATEFLSAGAH